MNEQKEKKCTETDELRQRLGTAIQNLDNPAVLKKMAAVLEEERTFSKAKKIPALQRLMREEANEELEVKTHQVIHTDSSLSRYDARVLPISFFLGVISLLLIGAVVTALTEEKLSPWFQNLLPWLLATTALFYLLNAVDVITLFILGNRSREKMNRTVRYRRLLSLLFPPLRIGARHIRYDQFVWLPVWGWSKANEGLFFELKRRFVLPMIGIALLIVPVLIIEWKFLEQVREEFPGLHINLILESVQTFIWCAFTFEFLLMISISKRRWGYVKKNWIDLLIILLPFVSFLRTLRISQIARLKYATRSFKLRGVITKARQGLIFVDFLQRILRLRPESEARRLYRQLRENQRDREDLENKLKQVIELIEKRQR